MSATDFEMELGFETCEKWCPVCEEYGHSLADCHEAADYATLD